MIGNDQEMTEATRDLAVIMTDVACTAYRAATDRMKSNRNAISILNQDEIAMAVAKEAVRTFSRTYDAELDRRHALGL